MKWLLAVVVLVGAVGCGEEGSGALTTVDTSVCSSGKKWTGGDEESPLMHPGQDCISCHATRHGPTFSVAGTVHAKANEPDDCAGVAGATVQITSATGAVTTLTTNAAGNFYSESKIDFPYTVKVISSGGTNQMSASQSTGACASCHTVTGANSAPGRVLAL